MSAATGSCRSRWDAVQPYPPSVSGGYCAYWCNRTCAYTKYVSRIGREPAPMVADFAAEIAAGRIVVIEASGRVDGYMIAWPETDAYFIDNIAVEPARQGGGLGRQLIDHAVEEGRRLRLPAVRLYTNAAMTENLLMYAHLGFIETHRAMEKGFHRVYLRLPIGEA
jgi:ribosomal protein S18 acetylase RimI-like enzyme